MKKSTLILIAVTYIASIVIISVFGMKAVVYNEVIPVTEIECLNETDERITVNETSSGIKRIEVKFDQPGNATDLTGTWVQLSWRVMPDNATNKDVVFVYDQEAYGDKLSFVKVNGKDVGLILINEPVYTSTPIRIMATDGSRVYTEVIIWAKY